MHSIVLFLYVVILLCVKFTCRDVVLVCGTTLDIQKGMHTYVVRTIYYVLYGRQAFLVGVWHLWLGVWHPWLGVWYPWLGVWHLQIHERFYPSISTYICVCVQVIEVLHSAIEYGLDGLRRVSILHS